MVAIGLLGAVVFYLIVGDRPFQHGVTGDEFTGSTLNRLLWLSFSAVAGGLILLRFAVAVRLAIALWPLVFMMLWIAASVVWSQFPDLTIRRAIVYMMALMVGIGIATWVRPGTAVLVTLATVLGAVMIVNILSALVWPDVAHSRLGVTGMHSQKNGAGTVAMLAITMLAFTVPLIRRPLHLLAMVSLLIGCAGFLVATRSKTSLALTALLPIALWPAVHSIRSGRAGPLMAGIAAAITGGLVVGLSVVAEIPGVNLLAALLPDLTVSGRDELWRAGATAVAARPWFGYGFGAYWSVDPDYSPLLSMRGWWTDAPEETTLNQYHNGMIDLLINTGLIGTGIALVFIFFLIHHAIHLLVRIDRGDRTLWTVLALLCLQLQILIHNMTESSLFFPSAQLGILFILFSILIVAWRRSLESWRRGPAVSASGGVTASAGVTAGDPRGPLRSGRPG